MNKRSTSPNPETLAPLSPFQLKDQLIAYAKDATQAKSATHKFLNAGRGNPNWLATTPRESFLLLGAFALEESKRVWDEPGFGGMASKDHIAARLTKYLDRQKKDMPGVQLLRRALTYGVAELGFDADAFVHELVDSWLGDNYPEPDRMLHHAEAVVERFLAKVMCDGRPPPGRFDLYAVEGGTAAMCYVFKSLVENRILRKGDTIALGTPIFTPYVEMPLLSDFAFHTVGVSQAGMREGLHTWQYTEAELAKLEDPKVKAFFIVNPSNPASFAMAPEAQARIIEIVRTKRPDLIILTDDVYGTFTPGFRSLAADLPRNTILVYSYSKHFGCTGWRLGVVALHENNILDDAIAALPDSDKRELQERYSSLTPDPARMKFIDRMVADSRDVALNHTAGLSLPQQLQMTLFSLFSLLDEGDKYTLRARKIVHERWQKLLTGLGISAPDDPLRVGYYADLDLDAWGRKHFGEDFSRFIDEHHDPLDIVLALARRFGTVLLNGSGFHGPPWSARVSLANLDADAYLEIGKHLREVFDFAVDQWKRSKATEPDKGKKH
jgi:aspartate 4-decarboxylase